MPVKNMNSRNADFLREIARQRRIAFAAGERMTDRMLAERAALAEAPGYYVDFDYAYRAVCRYLSAGRVERYRGVRPTERRAMLVEIAGRTRRLMDRNPRLCIKDAVTMVMASGRASCYFISRQYALRLFYELTEPVCAGRRYGRRLFRSNHRY